MPRSRLRRATIAGAIVVVQHACVDHRLAPPVPQPTAATEGVFVQNPQPKLDVLFLIDNSDSMKDKQDNLIQNFPVFMRVLEGSVPPGSALDAHIGVVSSDLGVASDRIGNCSTRGGDNGGLQSQPRGACLAGPRGSYISTAASGNNFDGTIEDVFSCIAALGTKGCGFEHQLAAVRRALGGDPDVPAPPENAGFLRDDARLGVIVITDEDDCSAPNGSDLFTSDTTVYGPVDSYRCNEYGHLCGGAPPPRAAVSGLTCESNETGTGRLIEVGEFLDFFRSLKPDPDLLRVAVVAGPPSPYGTMEVTQTDGTVATEVSPSCSSAVGNAAPAVRLKQLIDGLGRNGLFETICRDDFGQAMQHIAEALVVVDSPCVGSLLYDTDARQPGLQADCTVTETSLHMDGTASQVVLPDCGDAPAGTSAAPCWRLATAPRCAGESPDGVAVTVDRPGGAAAPPNTRTTWSCRVCADREAPGCDR